MTTTKLTPEQVVERNMRVVDAHFHNENPEDIDKAIELYGDSIVWEVPARGVLHRDKAAVKAAYLKMFESYKIHSMTPVRRFAADNYVVDDTVAEMFVTEKHTAGCRPNRPLAAASRPRD